MRTALITLLYTLLLLSLLAGCGSGTSPDNPGGGDVTVEPGPMDADNDIAAGGSRETSAAFTRFFSDVVNHQSMGRWSVANNSGQKAWTLSNTAYSSPKSWILGGNYWNIEDDTLTSNTFTVPGFYNFVRMSFWSRWSIAANDFGYVEYRIDGGSWQTLTTFTNGTNAAYPNWSKYYFEMPPNPGPGAQTWEIRYRFTSDNINTSWGFGVDEVSVYQTQLNPPINLTASSGQINQVTIDWDHNNAGNLEPELYVIYRAPDVMGAPGAYSFLTSVAYPADTYADPVPPGTYWYKVHAAKTNHPDGQFSNEDQGSPL